MPSPQYCPVCGERTWSSQDTETASEARRRYSVHIHTNHPEYERWNRQLERGSTFMLMAALFVLVTFLLIASMDTARLFTIPLCIVLIFIISNIVLIVRRRGTKRFRDLWKQVHGALANPWMDHTLPVASCSPEVLVRTRLRCSVRYWYCSCHESPLGTE